MGRQCPHSPSQCPPDSVYTLITQTDRGLRVSRAQAAVAEPGHRGLCELSATDDVMAVTTLRQEKRPCSAQHPPAVFIMPSAAALDPDAVLETF